MSEIDVISTRQSVVVDSASRSAHVISTTSPISVLANRTAAKINPAIPQLVNINPAGTDIVVLHQTQQIIVSPDGNTFSVVNAGPIGSRGPIGPSWPITVLTIDGQLLTRAGGDLAPITRADLAADVAFTTMADTRASTLIATHAAAADPHPGYVTTAEGATLISVHEAAADPHPGYVTTAEGAALISAHEAASNPHPTYLTQTEGDGLYVPLSQRAAANGVATLDASAKVPNSQLNLGGKVLVAVDSGQCSTARTPTTTSFVDIDGAAVTMSCEVGDLIKLTGHFDCTAAAADVVLVGILAVAGIATVGVAGVFGRDGTAVASWGGAFTCTYWYTATLTTHTFKLQGRNGAGGTNNGTFTTNSIIWVERYSDPG